jgi:hypothetical protein
MGRYIASTFANTKAKSLGLKEKESEQDRKYREFQTRQQVSMLEGEFLPSFGQEIPCVMIGASESYRAIVDGKPIDPTQVEKSLGDAFGIYFPQVEQKLVALADKFDKDSISEQAFKVYEKIRPPWNGWGAKSRWDMSVVDNYQA